MVRRLPLLNALKAFTVAGHHMSVTRAAKELSVTPSAVSHQVRALEDYVGVKLFIRDGRRLELTREGRQLLRPLEHAFDEIARAVQSVRVGRGKDRLVISLRPFFSVNWLAPRLNRFWVQHQNIELHLLHTTNVPDFFLQESDAAILWGAGNWPGLESELLIPGNLTPVCSPALLEGRGGPLRPEDLAAVTLLHEEDHTNWNAWLDLAGVPDLVPEHSLVIDDTNVRIHATLNNQGVMLGCPAMLEPNFRDGSLVRLFDIHLSRYSYYLAYPAGPHANKNLDAFLEWITGEARAFLDSISAQ